MWKLACSICAMQWLCQCRREEVKRGGSQYGWKQKEALPQTVERRLFFVSKVVGRYLENSVVVNLLILMTSVTLPFRIRL